MATSGDFKNDLIVRGGSPAENLFLLDSIVVPGLSHFGSQNSSGGFFGLLNANLVKDLDFYSGGFPAIYGDRLSSVTRVGLREGDRGRLSGRLNLSLFGATGTFEGPLPAGLGSWIASLRKDYFGVIPRNLTLGMTVVPDLADAQTKIVVDLSPRLQLSLVGLGAVDRITIEESGGDVASRMHMEIRDRLDVYGATLKSILGRFGVAYFTVSRTRSLYNYSEIRNGQENYGIRTGRDGRCGPSGPGAGASRRVPDRGRGVRRSALPGPSTGPTSGADTRSSTGWATGSPARIGAGDCRRPKERFTAQARRRSRRAAC